MNRKKSYGKNELEFLRYFLCNKFRTSSPGFSLPKLTIINLSLLEQAVQNLPKTERKSIESFFGLIPGSINHAKAFEHAKNLVNRMQMYTKALVALRTLCSLEYLYIYEQSSQELVKKIAKKIDYAQTGVNILDGVKYLMAYYLFLKDGPSMFYDRDEPDLNLASDKTLYLDHRSFIELLWSEWLSNIPDNDFKLDLVIQRINTSLDLTVKADILNYLKLDVPINLQEYVRKSFNTFIDIRIFKEEHFSAGPWLLFDSLVCKSTSEGINMEVLAEVLSLYCKGLLETIKTSGLLPLNLSYGEVKYPVYQKDRIAFIDPEEIDFIYLNRDLI